MPNFFRSSTTKQSTSSETDSTNETVENNQTLTLIPMIADEDMQELLSGFEMIKKFQFGRDKLHRMAKDAARILYQLGCGMINSQVNSIESNQPLALEQYWQLPENTIKNGSYSGNNPLQLAFIFKTALDALTTKEVQQLYHALSDGINMKTMGNSPLNFPNGSIAMDDSFAVALLHIYLQENQKLLGAPKEESFVSMFVFFLSGDSKAVADELHTLVQGRPADNTSHRAALNDYYEQAFGATSSPNNISSGMC